MRSSAFRGPSPSSRVTAISIFRNGSGSARWYLVVKPEQRELLEILRERLRGSGVEVVIERRSRERRRGSFGPVMDRRQNDRRRQRPVAFLNDADAAGIAEMTLGAGRDRAGTVMVITLGTGIGTALFVDGRLLPNTELGHLEVRGKEAEHRASAKVRADLDLDWVEWAAEVNEVLEAYHSLLWPDVFVIGGGVTENWQHFGSLLSSRAEIVPAAFGNDAGIVGAAMAAVQLER